MSCFKYFKFVKKIHTKGLVVKNKISGFTRRHDFFVLRKILKVSEF